MKKPDSFAKKPLRLRHEIIRSLRTQELERVAAGAYSAVTMCDVTQGYPYCATNQDTGGTGTQMM